MGTDNTTSAQGSLARPARVELVHVSERARVSRLFLKEGSFIRKEPLGPDAEKRLRHEVTLLERLVDVDGVTQLAGARAYPGSIMLEDAGRGLLAQIATPLEARELTSVALRLAQAVAGMHDRGVMHRDINPANIVLSDRRETACLVDFSLGTTFAELRPEFSHHNKTVGALAYMAPEQTGRTGRPVDQRADLYALGATLYELATGAPPFGTGDPLRLSHDHMARLPVPPAQVNPAVPPAFSEIVMHLLEKEPDNRYQTAEGLLNDFLRLQSGAVSLEVGASDFPLRLLPPSHLVGRDEEIAALGEAFAAAQSSQCRAVLVSGPPGVGKTSLIDELRPIATGADGWFVAGKFDQYRRDLELDAVHQAFRALGRLLLAEPDEQLADVRQRLLAALGPNAGLATAVTPEFATLLKVPPDPGDPATRQARAQRNALEILRVVASPKRPLVFVVDDLQWAAPTPLGLIDMVLTADEPVDGLLIVGAYREAEVDATHPLSGLLSRWQRQAADLRQLRLGNLPAASVTTMVADMLRLDTRRAAELAGPVAQQTRGNPYDTVELLNVLRHDGLLVPGDDGWQWDPAALQRCLGEVEVGDLFTARVEAMPDPTRSMLEAMACLAGRLELSLVQAATGLSAGAIEEYLIPALDDGLLVLEPGIHEEVRFRHDRIQEAILTNLTPPRQRALRRELARRLAVSPNLFAVAAQQYLPIIDLVRERDERRRVVELFIRAAEQAKLLSNHALMETQLEAAVELVDPDDITTLIAVQTGRYQALCSLGRLQEADEVFDTIDRLCRTPAERTEAVLDQVSSLTNRNRPVEAVALGLDQLRRLGVAVPAPEQLGAEIDRGLEAFHHWLNSGDERDDLRRPDVTDESIIAIAALINRLMPPAFFSDPAMMAWLALEALRMWAEHGPGRTLVGPVSHIAFVTTPLRGDYRTGYRAMRRIRAVSEQRGYEPDTSQARFLYALGTGHWFEPVEENVTEAQRAREGLAQGGDLQNACHTYYASLPQLFDLAPSLDSYIAEVESGLAFAKRTGNDQGADVYQSYQRLVSVLRGEPVAAPAEEASYIDRLAGNRVTAGNVYVTRALTAALMNDEAELNRQIAAMKPVLDAITATYPTATGHVVHALALAGRVRAATTFAERDVLVAELDTAIDWVAARAADAPGNFQHVLRLVEAERAWAVGDFPAADRAFDAALAEVATRHRPWHRALIAERAAGYYLAQGLEYVGHCLLTEAVREYDSWGASAKVNQLLQANPTLSIPRDNRREPVTGGATDSRIMTGAIDLLGIVAASQALSSETSVEGLRARVVEVLSTMTGATGVQLLLRSEDEHDWQLAATAPGSKDTIPIDKAGRRRLVPLSVIRYAERTREPLVINDATQDDRFARDPFLIGKESCSLVAIPILNRGRLSALLLLENRLIRGAFSAEHLDGVMLIAGQLAVSLDNALLYTSLERKVAERTQQLAVANQRLELLSATDPLTNVANRRRLEDFLAAQWRQGSSGPLSLAMIDVDHFKIYNDHYGHQAGDECLQLIAAELKRNTRDIDLVARYGGEEFAVVMPGTDITAAALVAERLRAAIVALALPHELAAAGIVTISLGVAALVPAPSRDAEALINLADVELYRAKRAGRNRVEVRSPRIEQSGLDGGIEAPGFA